MNLNRTLGLLVLAASVGAGGALATAATQSATTPTTTTAPAPMAGKHWHHRGSMLVGTMLRATHQLNLTAEQKQQIKGILESARTQHEQSGAAAPDMTVLGNPGDPNYATAVQSAKTLAAARLQKEIELQGQIYNVLTAEQKSQLPKALATMKAQAQQRRAAWQQRHEAAGSTGTGSSN